MGLSFPPALQKCLHAYSMGETCLMKEPIRTKRSLFGSNQHDDLQKVTSVFERNFKNILQHEKVRNNELQEIKHRVHNDENGLMEIRVYLKGLKTIEQLHRLQSDLYSSLVGDLENLNQDLTDSDFVKILDLFKTEDCKYLAEINSCVQLSSFIVDNFTVHGSYFHITPQMKNLHGFHVKF